MSKQRWRICWEFNHLKLYMYGTQGFSSKADDISLSFMDHYSSAYSIYSRELVTH